MARVETLVARFTLSAPPFVAWCFCSSKHTQSRKSATGALEARAACASRMGLHGQ